VITVDDVRAARATIGDALHRTPIFTSATLGPSVHLKAELFQKKGSFKPRGVLNKLRSLTAEERRRGVIAASAGNHAQALAYCARLEGIAATVVMWGTASAAKIAAARSYGADVDLEASGPESVFDRLAELEEESGRTLVRPWDDPHVVAGHGTLALEIVEDVPVVDVVVVPVGGGGLIAGVATALPDTRIVGVEPALSSALTAGVAAGKPTPVKAASIADGLNAPFAGELPIEIATARALELILVDEAEIEDAMRFLYQRAKLACEPAGAVAVAALRAKKVPLKGGETIVAVVSGGNVSTETAVAILGRP
jgi:threonine dehydratase